MKKEDQKKPGELKLDFKNLPELPKNAGLNLPKPPPINYGKKEESTDFKERREFTLSSE